MPRRPRRNLTPDQKADLLRRHLVDKVPVSDLCNEHDLQPSVFYNWLRQLFDNAGTVFETPKRPAPTREKELAERVEQLEAKLAKKDEVIAEISEEYVKLKKRNGEP
jgi:transposase-like protein